MPIHIVPILQGPNVALAILVLAGPVKSSFPSIASPSIQILSPVKGYVPDAKVVQKFHKLVINNMMLGSNSLSHGRKNFDAPVFCPKMPETSTSNPCMYIVAYMHKFIDAVVDAQPSSIFMTPSWFTDAYAKSRRDHLMEALIVEGETTSEDSTSSSRCNPTAVSVDLWKTSLKDTADSFVAGHIQQYNLKNGPYASRLTAASLTIATLLAVLMMVDPLTHWELRMWTKDEKGSPDASKPTSEPDGSESGEGSEHRLHVKSKENQGSPDASTQPTSKLPLYFCLGIVNLIIGGGILSPIIVAMVDQYKKQNRFDTWAILARAQKVNNYGSQFVFLTFVEGSSKFYNTQIWGWYIGACIVSSLGVLWLTVHYTKKWPPLLKKCDDDDVDKNKDSDHSTRTTTSV